MNMMLIAQGEGRRICGADVTRATGLKSGTLYPILARMEEAGWVGSILENIDPVKEGRPRRRLYKLAPAGKKVASESSESLGRLAENLTAQVHRKSVA